MKHVSSKYINDYKLSNDFNKIVQIIDQYRVKYSRDLSTTSKGTRSLNTIKDELTRIVGYFYEKVGNQSEISEWKEEVIVLDYLVTLRQLVGLLQNNDL
jgi:hypothetical protein